MKKKYTPQRSDNEQKVIHIKVLIGAILITIIVVVIFITSQ